MPPLSLPISHWLLKKGPESGLELNWNDEPVPLNWIVDPGALEKFKVNAVAWVVPAQRIAPNNNPTNGFIAFTF